MKKFIFPAASAAAALSMVLSPTMASAATLPTPLAGYGFDGNAHLIVGGGSTTVYKVAQGLADLYNSTASCATNNSSYDSTSGSVNPANPISTTNPVTYPQSSAAFNQCSPTSQTYSGGNAGGNYDGDTVAIAASAGSSTGIASLNGDHGTTASTYAYEGTNGTIPTTGDPNSTSGYTNGFGTVDFALSSRAPKTTSGNCSLNQDELQCDTFWGVAADGVEVFTWGSTAGSTTDNTNLGTTSGFTANDLYNIFTCKYTTWQQLPEYASNPSAYPPATAPIVPWSMNSNSGTYSDFDNYVTSKGSLGTLVVDNYAGAYTGSTTTSGGAPDPQPTTGLCDRELTGGNPEPLENDVKPLLTDVQNNQGGLSTDPMSTNNPANWVWFGSFGLLSAYQYLSQPSLFNNQYNTFAAPIAGTLPTSGDIFSGSYPIPRILSLVTKKADADCPVDSGGSACDFTGNPGPTNGNGTTDLNVTGASSGSGGAVREFIRFVCRTKAQSSTIDPYTGTADSIEIGSVLTASGFVAVPPASKTKGSNCDVLSVG